MEPALDAKVSHPRGGLHLALHGINELRDELRKNFDEIIYLNTENLKSMANNQISIFQGVAPEGLLKNTLTFYADNNSINICFHHSILTTIFKNHVDNFVSQGKEI